MDGADPLEEMWEKSRRRNRELGYRRVEATLDIIGVPLMNPYTSCRLHAYLYEGESEGDRDTRVRSYRQMIRQAVRRRYPQSSVKFELREQRETNERWVNPDNELRYGRKPRWVPHKRRPVPFVTGALEWASGLGRPFTAAELMRKYRELGAASVSFHDCFGRRYLQSTYPRRYPIMERGLANGWWAEWEETSEKRYRDGCVLRETGEKVRGSKVLVYEDDSHLPPEPDWHEEARNYRDPLWDRI